MRSCATRADPALAAKTAGRVAAGNWTPPTQRCPLKAAVTDKVHHITTIARVAADLGQDDDCPRDVANKTAIEDGFIGV